MTRFVPLLLALTAWMAQPLWAAEPVSGASLQTLAVNGGALTVTAEEMAFSNQAGQVNFSGSVHVSRDGMEMFADRLRVTLEQESEGGERRINKLVAMGNVLFTHGERRATAGHAEFDPTNDTVILTESPTVTDNNMEVVGRRITIDLATQESIVEGGAFTFTEQAQ